VENLQKEYLLMRATCEQRFPSTALSQGNIKARLRMIYLYNIASVTGGLVMDTDNLTEHNLGFWTIHGDVADYNPIGGLWKHEVYALCKYLFTEVFTDEQSVQHQALKSAYGITPTDGNGVAAGGDMAQIAPGHTYEEVDDILNTYLQAKEKCQEVDAKAIKRYKKVLSDEKVAKLVLAEEKFRHQQIGKLGHKGGERHPSHKGAQRPSKENPVKE
jgi:NH3-dependent NAD+ synthetase